MGSEAFFRTDFVRYRGRAEGLKYEITVSVEKDKTAKIVEAELENPTDREKVFELAYYIKPVMGQDSSGAVFLKADKIDGGIKISSPIDAEFPGVIHLTADEAKGICVPMTPTSSRADGTSAVSSPPPTSAARS